MAVTALLAVVAWAVIVLIAEAMRRRGYRGPAEVMLGRLTYGRSLGPPRDATRAP